MKKNRNTKSLKKNAVLNSIRVSMSLLFPLITFPYASRILGAKNIGKVQFSSSVITFIMLFAALGISSYAVREGASLRDDRKKISKFASELFSINIIFTVLAYILLILLIVFIPKLQSYTLLLIVLSIQVIFTTLGVDWIYTIYEDFTYITIRSIVTQIFSLILLFILVHSKNDYYLYALVTTIANSGTNIFNFIHSKKYIDLKFTFDNHLRNHIKSLFTLFANNIAQQIYINSDVLMLGFMTSDYYVGIYSVAVKIYTAVKQILNAIIVVAVPRLAYLSGENTNDKFLKLGSTILNVCLFSILPILLLLFLLSDNIVLFLSGKDYILAGQPVKILSFGLIFAVFANFFCNGILIVKKEEKYVLNATILAAFTNFILNLLFIKLFKQNGAAFTTVIAEFIVMIYSFYHSRKYIKVNNFSKNLLKSVIGCIGIVLIYFILKKLSITNILFIIMVGILGLMSYIFIEIVIKNDAINNLFSLNKLRKEE